MGSGPVGRAGTIPGRAGGMAPGRMPGISDGRIPGDEPPAAGGGNGAAAGAIGTAGMDGLLMRLLGDGAPGPVPTWPQARAESSGRSRGRCRC